VFAINPDCNVHALHSLFTKSNAEEILATRYDGLLDAIDSPSLKALLIARCRERGIPVVTTGGAGGRRDPAALCVEDMARTTHDALLQATRKILRAEYDFPRGEKKFDVPCVYSPEAPVFPNKDGSVCERPEPGSNLRLDCRSGYGTACFVTGAFGFVAAAQLVRMITEAKPANG
jgi:tRNA A37 threonylcarbamoyladenosine dehydratase